MMLTENQENPKCQYTFQISTNIWLLTIPSSAVTTCDAPAVTLICPGEISKSITTKKPIHTL